MNEIILEKIFTFLGENYRWLIPSLFVGFILIVYRKIKIQGVQMQKGGGSQSTNIQVGRDFNQGKDS